MNYRELTILVSNLKDEHAEYKNRNKHAVIKQQQRLLSMIENLEKYIAYEKQLDIQDAKHAADQQLKADLALFPEKATPRYIDTSTELKPELKKGWNDIRNHI